VATETTGCSDRCERVQLDSSGNQATRRGKGWRRALCLAESGKFPQGVGQSRGVRGEIPKTVILWIAGSAATYPVAFSGRVLWSPFPNPQVPCVASPSPSPPTSPPCQHPTPEVSPAVPGSWRPRCERSSPSSRTPPPCRSKTTRSASIWASGAGASGARTSVEAREEVQGRARQGEAAVRHRRQGPLFPLGKLPADGRGSEEFDAEPRPAGPLVMLAVVRSLSPGRAGDLPYPA